MENYTLPPQGISGEVPIKPDKAEKKLIRRKYLKVGAVIVFNMLMFNIVLLGAVYLIGGFLGEGETIAERTREWLSQNEAANTLISCLIPIISESLSIILGIVLLKIDMKKLFNLDGFTGKELTNTVIISLGLQTLAALLAQAVAFLLKQFGLESPTADLSATTSAGATIFMYFYACLLGPVLEELMYRGVILQGLRKYNERFAIIVSALIFGLMHQNYQQFILGFMLGLVLAAAALRSGSLIPSIVTHIIVNTSGVLMQLIMQNADYAAFDRIAGGELDMTGMNSGFIAAVAVNAVFRYGLLITGFILLIITAVKKNSVRKPTPAGKTRGWPILAQSWIWYIVWAGYIYLAFIHPFILPLFTS